VRTEPIVVDLDRFAQHLKMAWREGEQRATHRRPYRRRKPILQRPSMLDGVRDQIQAWLEGEPGMSALEVLARLKAAQPECFTDKHLRTVQRAVKDCRRQVARRAIMESAQAVAAAIGRPLEVSTVADEAQRCGSPTWVHRDLPRLAALDSVGSLREARVPPVDYVDDPLDPQRQEVLGNISE